MKLVIIIIAVLGIGAWLALGLFIAQGPQPEIILPAEIITTVGPLNISNTLITSWAAMILIIALSLAATRSMKLMPSGVQNFVEAGVGFLVDQCEEIAGRENGRRFFSVVATIFIFIIISNWMGLLPIFNSIGKTEDVGHEIFHLIEEHSEEGKPFEEAEHLAAWVMEDGGWVIYTKPNGDEFEFEFHQGDDPAEALDRYIVALAEQFTDFETEDTEHPSSETVMAAGSGYVEFVDVDKLNKIAESENQHLELLLRPGDFVIEHSPILRIYYDEEISEACNDKLRLCISLGRKRTPFSDIEFAIMQLLQIALRALSPGINDSLTAIACIDWLSASLGRMANKNFPPEYLEDSNGVVRVKKRGFCFTDAVDTMFHPLRQNVTTNEMVMIHLLETISRILQVSRKSQYSDALFNHAELIIKSSKEHFRNSSDAEEIAKRFEKCQAIYKNTKTGLVG